ncbi:MAG: serine/threonine-protein kinase [Dehalococcoidia bacterium]
MDQSGNSATLGNYILESAIGRGGMGTVYRARHRMLGNTVAIKIIHSHLVHDPTARDRFLREATVAAGLRHPNIVRVFDFGAEGERVYLVMDYLAGEPLSSLMKAGTLTDDRLLHILRQTASAIDYLHQQGYVHRDVKPANIIVDSSLNTTLVDFGIARALEGGLITSGDVISGTPLYLAPEVFQGDRPGPAADGWALAVTAFEGLTGQRPFTAQNQAQLMQTVVRGEPRRATQARPNLPREVDVVFARQLSKRPTDRYPSADAFVLGLQSALRGQLIVPVQRTEPPSRPGTPDRTAPVSVRQNLPPQASNPPPVSMPPPMSLTPADVFMPNTGPPPAEPQSRPLRWIVIGIGTAIVTMVGAICLGLGGVFAINQVQQGNANATDTARAGGTRTAIARSTSQAVATETALVRGTATAQAAIARIEATASAAAAGAQVRFGPVGGSFPHEEDGFIESRSSGVNLADFIVETTFFNPFSPSEKIWDIGFLFRDTGTNQQYRLILYPSAASGGLYNLVLVEGDAQNTKPVGCVSPLQLATSATPPAGAATGPLPAGVFRNAAGEANKVRLVARGTAGWLYVNDVLVLRCALDAKTAAGDIEAGIGFFNDRELAGRSTRYDGFTVWGLP